MNRVSGLGLRVFLTRAKKNRVIQNHKDGLSHHPLFFVGQLGGDIPHKSLWLGAC